MLERLILRSGQFLEILENGSSNPDKIVESCLDRNLEISTFLKQPYIGLIIRGPFYTSVI